jgi:hypothetical protein
MGLDMYLSIRKYVGRLDLSAGYDEVKGWSHNDEFDKVMGACDMSEFLETDNTTGLHVEVPVMYWRKANAIHKWFIDNRADGEDNCQPIFVLADHLDELLELCNQVLADRTKAEELLPTEGGFFFGPTEYDDWYFEGLEYTQRRLTELLPLMKRKNEKGYCDNDTAVYQASW